MNESERAEFHKISQKMTEEHRLMMREPLVDPLRHDMRMISPYGHQKEWLKLYD